MISPAAGTRITAMVSPVDGSKPTTPRSWRRDVASCRRPRTASSAATRRCRQMTGGKGGKGGNLQSFGNSSLFDDGATRRKPAETGGNPLQRLCSRNCPQFCCLTQGGAPSPDWRIACGNCGNSSCRSRAIACDQKLRHPDRSAKRGVEGPVLLPRRQEEVPRLRRPLGGFARDDGKITTCDSPVPVETTESDSAACGAGKAGRGPLCGHSLRRHRTGALVVEHLADA